MNRGLNHGGIEGDQHKGRLTDRRNIDRKEQIMDKRGLRTDRQTEREDRTASHEGREEIYIADKDSFHSE